MKKLTLLLLPLLLLACGVVYAPVVGPTQTATSQQNDLSVKKQGQISTETPNPCTGMVTATKSLNLRYEPSTDSAADPDGLRHGDIVTVLDIDNGWLYIQIGDRFGWAKEKYIKKECR